MSLGRHVYRPLEETKLYIDLLKTAKFMVSG
jgi:hypothetical protein